MTRFLPFILFCVFCVLAALSLMRLQSDTAPDSPWIGHKAPALKAEAFTDGTGEQVIAPHTVTVLNIFASWCGPCIAEHPLFKRIALESRAEIVGLAWNDSRDAVSAFIDEHGNPFSRIYLDNGSGAALELGIRGVPETFIIDKHGVIRFHFAGPLSEQVIEERIVPLLKVLEP